MPVYVDKRVMLFITAFMSTTQLPEKLSKNTLSEAVGTPANPGPPEFADQLAELLQLPEEIQKKLAALDD